MRCVLLGPMEVVDDTGRWCPVAGVRQRTLLAALALRANELVSQDALAEAVWDGAPPPGYATTLRSHLTHLRRSLGPRAAARIITRAPGYLIELSEAELDLVEFESLCREANTALHAGAWEQAMHDANRALGLWRGEPLVDVPSRILRDAFVPRLEQLLAQAHEDHIEAQLRLGLHERVILRLRDLTSRYPLRERFHAQRVLALAGAGRRAEALDAYQHARKALVDELGIEPGPELRAAQDHVLAGTEPPVFADSSHGTDLADVGRAKCLAGDYSGAEHALIQALEQCRAHGRHDGEAVALIDLGRVRYLMGDHFGACDAHTHALRIYRALGQRDGEAYVLTESGRARILLGDHSGADDAYACALDLYRAMGDRGKEAWALGHHAATLAAVGQHSRALELYRQALAINRGSDESEDQAMAFEGLGQCHLATGEPETGAAHLRHALEIFRRLGRSWDAERIRACLAEQPGT